MSNIERLQDAALKLLLETSDKKASERQLQRRVLFILRVKFGPLSRDPQLPIVFQEEHIFIGKSSHPKRVDYIKKGTNPIPIELAVRPSDGNSELYGYRNRDELNKLTRYTPSKARLRALLLVDMKDQPIDRARLKQSYDTILSGPGNYERTSVRVIYSAPMPFVEFPNTNPV